MKKQHKFSENTANEQIDIDHIVIFKKRPNANFLPGWSLGRIIGTKPSNDGVTRTVTVEYVNRTKSNSKNDTNKQGDIEEEEYEASMKGLRKKIDNDTYKTQTIRQVDEIIRIHRITPRDNDIHLAIQQILTDHQQSNENQGPVHEVIIVPVC
jgi:hypothetical protein